MAFRVRRNPVLSGARWRGWLLTALAGGSVALLLPLAVFLVATWLQGWQLQNVLSGSMAPTYPVGSLLIVEEIDASQVKAGMALVFEDPTEAGRIVTHRVVGPVPEDASAFRTRGDANATNDPAAVPARNVRGRVLWSINGLGAVITWLQWPNAFLLFVVAPGVLLLGSEALRWRRRLGELEGEPASAT